MKKILVIFTGGTIGSKKDHKQIDVQQSSAYELLERYEQYIWQQGIARQVQFDTRSPLQILSENLLPRDWLKIKESLMDVDFAGYAGIIITHGSDTLAYTAAALSFMLHDAPIPILLTASNYPLDDERSNGLGNFSSCVDFIVEQPSSGVFVIFEDYRGETIVHLGSRLLQSAPFTDQFESVHAAPLGKMKNGSFVWLDNENNITIEQLQQRQNKLALNKQAVAQQSRLEQETQDDLNFSFTLEQIHFCEEILYIKPYPGIVYDYYDFSGSQKGRQGKRKPKAVLHDLYHSGTASTREIEDEHVSLQHFIAYCQQQRVDFYIAPMKNVQGSLYASSHKLLQYGAIPLENISVEAALVKLMLAYGTLQSKEEIAAFLSGPALFFEYNKMTSL